MLKLVRKQKYWLTITTNQHIQIGKRLSKILCVLHSEQNLLNIWIYKKFYLIQVIKSCFRILQMIMSGESGKMELVKIN